MAATAADVARHAGLSRGTVSQVLNGHAHRFAEDTAERVRRAADELGYEPSVAGRMLRTGSSDFVIALVPNTTFGSNLQDIFGGTTDLLEERGLTLVLRLATQSPSSLDRLLAGMRPRAVLSLQPFTEAERRLLDDRNVPGFDTSAGMNINYEIGRIQAEHLVAQGYQQIAFAHLRDSRQDPYGDDRDQAVRDVCVNAGLAAPLILGLGLDAGEADAALHGLPDGTGVACYNDDIAIALLFAALRNSRLVPDAVGLIGMDNTPLSRVTNPRLTTVGYDLTAVARATVTATLAALGLATRPGSIDINLRVISGGSTRARASATATRT